ncbi:hypothetical protein ACFLWY_02865 [Chloroflexota bacterium]
MDSLITSIRRIGFLLIIGFVLIIYAALGFLYFQQGPKQDQLRQQSDSIHKIVVKPLPSDENLRAEYDEVTQLLLPMTVETVLETIVGIAAEAGIDVTPETGKLIIPPAATGEEKVGTGTYEVLSFHNIAVQGGYENVMAFLSDVDSGKTLKNMVLKRVAIDQVVIEGEEEEELVETRATMDVDLYVKPQGESS